MTNFYFGTTNYERKITHKLGKSVKVQTSTRIAIIAIPYFGVIKLSL